MKPFEAQSRARHEFGPAARAREETRDAWRFQWLEDLVLDMRRAMRSLRRSPALALTAIGCLALGIGANTLIFSLVHAILLRSLPYPDAGRLVMVRFSPPNQPNQKLGTNPPEYFRTLRIPLLRGREFSPADSADSRPVAVSALSFQIRIPLGTESKQACCTIRCVKLSALPAMSARTATLRARAATLCSPRAIAPKDGYDTEPGCPGGLLHRSDRRRSHGSCAGAS